MIKVSGTVFLLGPFDDPNQELRSRKVFVFVFVFLMKISRIKIDFKCANLEGPSE